MAKKPIDTPLPDIYDDWRLNPRDPNKLGYSGNSVMTGIQNKFRENDARLKRLEDEVGGGSVDFRFIGMPSGNVIVNGAAPYPFTVHVKSMLVYKDENGEDIEEEYDRNVHLDIDVILNGASTTTKLGNIPANKDVMVNITPYVADGAAFALRAYNDDGNYVRSSYYDVVMANIGVRVASNAWWAVPYVDDDASWNIPLLVNLNINAMLKATLTDANGVIRSSRSVPATQLSENYSLTLDHPTVNGGASGIYDLRVELYATDDNLVGLAADPLDYKVCCVNALNTENFLIINNVTSGKLANYASNKVFEYAMRIGYGNPVVRFSTSVDGKVVSDTGELSVSPNTIYPYNLAMELERTDDSDFTATIVSSVDDTEVNRFGFVVSNKNGYAATAGASFLLRFNGRTNSESNRGTFFNAIDGSAITPEITGVGWTGADGYHTEVLADGATRTAFRLLAGSRMKLPVTPLAMRASEARSIEFVYKVNNVRNFEASVMRCMNEDGYGFDVSPNEAVVYTPSALNHDDQNAGGDYAEIMHLVIIVRPLPVGATKTVDNFSCIQIYINGCRQRWFEYNRDLNVDAPLWFGSDDCDLDLYAVRIYDKVLTEAEVEQNTCNMLHTDAAKQTFKNRNLVRENGKVDFSRVRSMCNVIVFDCKELPSRTWDKTQTTAATIENYWLGSSDVDVQEVNNLAWQGTTSHNYGTNAEYGGLGQNYKWTAPDGTKMCAKANWASSMQSHKIGLTAAYTDLAVSCGVIGDGQRLSILQRPMAGFQRKADGTLMFIGLFTVGADKGDKPTFGWTGKSLFLEGKDNEPLGTNFILPWNEDTATVDSSFETYSICGVKAWEDASKKPEYIAERWVPTYNFVWSCMQRLRPAASVEEMTNESYNYWMVDGDAQYHVFYKSNTEWKDSGLSLMESLVDKGYGLVSADLEDKDAEAKNELFLAARRAKFKAEVTRLFHKDNFLFHHCFIEFFACTDNFSKNTYPFMLDATDPSSVFMWRQDDLDSALKTENQGKNYKLYCVEVNDNYLDYGRNDLMVFNGTQNQFWLLVRLCFADELEAFMREKFIPSLTYGQSSDAATMFAAWCQHYFFDNAQSYFPEALYNETGRLRYGYGHMSNGYQYQGIALSQDSGNCYLAEKNWLRMRYIYMSSKYLVGNFAAGSKTDVFSTRAYTSEVGNTFEITPAIYMYPSVQFGETGMRGERIFPGSELKTWIVTLPPPSGDQEQRINGMSYIKSLGAMYKAAFSGSVNVNGRMLTELQMGTRDDKDSMRSRITSIGLGDATSLQNLTLSNIETLGGVVDASLCVNMRELYAEGTNITAIPLCDGGALTTIYYPASLTSLVLIGKTSLSTMVFEDTDNITNIEVRNCSQFVTGKVLDILTSIYYHE